MISARCSCRKGQGQAAAGDTQEHTNTKGNAAEPAQATRPILPRGSSGDRAAQHTWLGETCSMVSASFRVQRKNSGMSMHLSLSTQIGRLSRYTSSSSCSPRTCASNVPGRDASRLYTPPARPMCPSLTPASARAQRGRFGRTTVCWKPKERRSRCRSLGVMRPSSSVSKIRHASRMCAYCSSVRATSDMLLGLQCASGLRERVPCTRHRFGRFECFSNRHRTGGRERRCCSEW
jgi:hypothetical protein